jgi:hypothetical protein
LEIPQGQQRGREEIRPAVTIQTRHLINCPNPELFPTNGGEHDFSTVGSLLADLERAIAVTCNVKLPPSSLLQKTTLSWKISSKRARIGFFYCRRITAPCIVEEAVNPAVAGA